MGSFQTHYENLCMTNILYCRSGAAICGLGWAPSFKPRKEIFVTFETTLCFQLSGSSLGMVFPVSTWQCPCAHGRLHKGTVWCGGTWLACQNPWPQTRPTPLGWTGKLTVSQGPFSPNLRHVTCDLQQEISSFLVKFNFSLLKTNATLTHAWVHTHLSATTFDLLSKSPPKSLQGRKHLQPGPNPCEEVTVRQFVTWFVKLCMCTAAEENKEAVVWYTDRHWASDRDSQQQLLSDWATVAAVIQNI